MTNTTTAYQFDSNGYLIGSTMVMADPRSGEWLLPPDVTLTKPSDKKGYWHVWNKENAEWILKKIPTTAEELEGEKVIHKDLSKHKYELLALINTLVTDDSGYSVKRDEENNIVVVKKEPEPEPTFEELKEKKLQELTDVAHKFDNQLVNEEMLIKSSLGFTVNADLRSQNNINGLIAAGVEPVDFIDAANEIHELTLEHLTTLQSECILNGQYLYQQKWAFRAQINACTTKEELEAITFDFKMKDFNE